MMKSPEKYGRKWNNIRRYEIYKIRSCIKSKLFRYVGYSKRFYLFYRKDFDYKIL